MKGELEKQMEAASYEYYIPETPDKVRVVRFEEIRKILDDTRKELWELLDLPVDDIQARKRQIAYLLRVNQRVGLLAECVVKLFGDEVDEVDACIGFCCFLCVVL